MPEKIATTANIQILVIDDNLINRQYFSFALAKKGFSVNLAEDGFAAIKLAKKNNFDLILTDIKMPDMDGYETTRKIKQIRQHQNTPVVATSAETIAEKNQHLFESCLLKPIKLQELYATVEKFCLNNKIPKDEASQKALDFNQKQALAFAYNDKQIMQKMISMFSQELPLQITQLAHSLSNNSHKVARDLIHKIRGSCKTCGADNLDTNLEKLSKSIKDNDLDKINDVFSQVKSASVRFIKFSHQ
ncbi:MAG TPA: response regulator [Oceanospirillales bacterium]|nr:response regulator [Oceanospirillales bacterium]